MRMRSNNAVIKKCVVQRFGVQRFGVRTPEWTENGPESSQDDPKMVPSLPKMSPMWLPDSQITPVFSDLASVIQDLRTQWKIQRNQWIAPVFSNWKMVPRWRQDGPKKAPSDPKMPPRYTCCSKSSRDSFQMVILRQKIYNM